MTDETAASTLADIYGDIELDDAEFEAIVDRSLNPRGPDSLFDTIGDLGLAAGHLLLDAGCGRGQHAIELARRFGCRVLGLDALPDRTRLAGQAAAEAGLAGRVGVLAARVEAIPAAAGTFDYIWCRDMLNHVPDLGAAFAEFARVLQPDGRLLVFHTFATDRLEPREAAQLYAPLAIVAQNMAVDYFEAAAWRAGFEVQQVDEIGSEWREWGEEHGDRRTSRQLLRLARLSRDADRLRAELGATAHAVELADCTWGVYQMLGKLSPRVYVFRRSSNTE